MSLPQPPPILWRSSRCLLSPVHRLSSSYLSVALSFRLSIFDLHEFIFGHWNLSKASYFCLSLFCHCVFMSQFSQFILVHQNLSGSLLSPFYCLFILLSYCLTVFLSFCHQSFYFSSSQFILIHWNLPGNLLSPFYCLSYFCLNVFLSLCLPVAVHLQFISDHLSSLEVVLVLLGSFGAFPGD